MNEYRGEIKQKKRHMAAGSLGFRSGVLCGARADGLRWTYLPADVTCGKCKRIQEGKNANASRVSGARAKR